MSNINRWNSLLFRVMSDRWAGYGPWKPCETATLSPEAEEVLCSTCNTLHEAEDVCPYCAGYEDGAAEADAARRATEFAVKQQEMLAGQMAARDRIITSLQAVREDDLSEAATLRARIAELARQRDLARADYALASNRLKVAAARVIALETLHTAARRWVARLFLGGAGLAGAGALGWLSWDALRPLAAYLPGSRTWAEVAVVLALVLVLRWPVTRRNSPEIPDSSPSVWCRACSIHAAMFGDLCSGCHGDPVVRARSPHDPPCGTPGCQPCIAAIKKLPGAKPDAPVKSTG